jgi:threonine/homoserine/homoserine lactone efflux protein
VPAVHTIALFALAAIGLLLVPGPAVLYITSRSAAHGRRAGLVSVLGVHTGTLVHIAAAAAGLSAVLVASAAAFEVVKLAGAVYLIGLGVRTLAGARAAGSNVGGRVPKGLSRIYFDGFVVNVLNPKTALFFLAFLPQFVDPHGPVWSETLALGLVFVGLGLVSDSLYALGGARLGAWLRDRPRAARRGQVAEGAVLVGLGVAALASPATRPR